MQHFAGSGQRLPPLGLSPCPGVTLAPAWQPHLLLPMWLFVKGCAESIGFSFQRKDLLTKVALMSVIKAEVLCSLRPPSRPSGPEKPRLLNRPVSPWQQQSTFKFSVSEGGDYFLLHICIVYNHSNAAPAPRLDNSGD